MDGALLDRKVVHVADGELLSALRTDLPGLERFAAAAAAGDMEAAWESWKAYVGSYRERRTLPAPATARGDTDPGDLLAEADRIVRRDIKCWGGVRIRYGGEVDFSRNLPGSANYGFHYFGWIVPLAAAWRATRREKYAQAFVDIFRRWYLQRDLVRGDVPGYDAIWYELGTGARMPVFTDLYFSTLDSRAAGDPGYHRDMLKTALGHGRWLHAHETSYREGNWQMYGARGLLLTGLAFPEFRESGLWVRRALRWLLEHARRDVYADGCHKERAPHYHLGVAGSFRSAAALLDGRGDCAPQRRLLARTARLMYGWTAGVLTPTGHSPAVGDSEYDVPDPRLLPRRPAGASADLQASGFLVARSGRTRDALWFLANYGPWGGGHSHGEALAFQFWCHGRPLAVDCGRGISYDDPLHKTWYVTPYAHNMVVVDGAAPSVEGRRGRLLFHSRAGGAELIGLEHAGYAGIGVRHRRCFLIGVRRRYLAVFDFLRADDSDHLYEWVLNTPVRGIRAGAGRIAGRGLTVLSSDPGTVGTARLSTVRMCLPLEGRTTWGSPRPEGTNARFLARGGTLGLHFLLAPVESPRGVRFRVERMDGRSPYRLRVTAAAPGFEERWDVDCARGSLVRRTDPPSPVP